MPAYKRIKVVLEIEVEFKGDVQTIGEAVIKAEKLIAEVPGCKVVTARGEYF